MAMDYVCITFVTPVVTSNEIIPHIFTILWATTSCVVLWPGYVQVTVHLLLILQCCLASFYSYFCPWILRIIYAIYINVISISKITILTNILLIILQKSKRFVKITVRHCWYACCWIDHSCTIFHLLSRQKFLCISKLF